MSALKTVSFRASTSRAGDARDGDELADRELDVDVLQVVLRGRAPRTSRGPRGAIRHRDRPLPRQELPGDRLRVLLDLRGGASATTCPPCSPAPGPCRPGGRPSASSARRARPRARCCRGRAAAPASRSASSCRAGGARSTARRGCRGRRRAASRSASPAAAAPRRRRASPQRGRAAGTDADVVEEGQPLADLLDDPSADQLLGLGQLERVEELDRARDRHLRELVDVPRRR